MGIIIGIVGYIVVCNVICKMFDIESFNGKALVYAIVSVFGGAIIKSLL